MSIPTLTFTAQTSQTDCPPHDTYVLELARIGDFHEKPGFDDPTVIQTQSKWDFTIVDFEYDSDVDARDWNGVTVSDYLIFYRKQPDGEIKETWKNEKANANKMIAAFLGRAIEDGEDVDLQDFLGKRIKATVAPKASGWPKISSPMPHKSRRRKTTSIEDQDVNPYKQVS